jgi:hypothetical protein
MGWICGMHGGGEARGAYRILVGILLGNDHWADQEGDGRNEIGTFRIVLDAKTYFDGEDMNIL